MSSRAVGERAPRPLLTLGRVDLVRVQVGHRTGPADPAYQHFLLDIPMPDHGRAVDESALIAALEPVLYVGTDTPRHYSIHQHRWHTSWGPSPGALEIGVLVTTGASTTRSPAAVAGVTGAFRDILAMVGRPESARIARADAVGRARRSAVSTYGIEPDALSVSVAEHHAVDGSWSVGLRSTTQGGFDVVVGFVDGYVGSVSVRHDTRIEVSDSVGSE
jgi:hypothetical protein